MPADEAGGAVGHRQAHRLRIDQRLVAVVQRVVAGVEVAHERFVVTEIAGGQVHRQLEPAAHPPAVEFRIDPAVRVVAPVRAQRAHGVIDAVQVGHQHRRHCVHVQRRDRRRGQRQLLGGEALALEVHHQVVVAGGPDDHLQQIVRIVVGPHGNRPRRLAGGVVALADAQRQTEHAEHAGDQLHLGRPDVAQCLDDGGVGVGAQGLAQLPPQRRRHRRREQHAPFQHQRQAVGGLGGFREHRGVDQRVDQILVAEQGIAAGGAQPQGRAYQLGGLGHGEAQEHRLIRRHQTGVVHRAGEAVGLLLQGLAVHARQALGIHLQPRILHGRLGGSEQGAHQTVRAAAVGYGDRRVVQAGGDLRDHRFKVVHPYRPLGQNPPDLLDQPVDDVVVTDARHQQLQHAAHGHRHAPLAHANRFAAGLEQQIQVQRQHLGQIMVRLFGGQGFMGQLALGHRQQAKFAETFQGDVVGGAQAQGLNGDVRLQNLRVGPVGA